MRKGVAKRCPRSPGSPRQSAGREAGQGQNPEPGGCCGAPLPPCGCRPDHLTPRANLQPHSSRIEGIYLVTPALGTKALVKHELLRTPHLQPAVSPQLYLCHLFFAERSLISATSPVHMGRQGGEKTEVRVMAMRGVRGSLHGRPQPVLA